MPDVENKKIYTFNQALEWIIEKRSNLTADEFFQVPRYEINSALDKILFALVHGKLSSYFKNNNKLEIFNITGSYDFNWDANAIGIYEDFGFNPKKSLADLYFYEFGILREFPARISEPETKQKSSYFNKFELLYKNNTIFLQVNDINQFEIKKLKEGKAKQVFEYIYNNPNKELIDTDIAAGLGIKWETGDRLDQIIRNVIEIESFIKLWFPICKTHEIKLRSRFYLHSRVNKVNLDEITVDEIQF